MTTDRLAVAKTYKLYVGGGFPRSESGRSYPVTAADGRLLAHAALASRKDVQVKVLAKGAISKPLTVHAHRFSASAREAIEAAGGTCQTVAD